MPSTIIDFHVHAFPDPASRLARHLPEALRETLEGPLNSSIEGLKHLRRQARTWTRTLSQSLHRSQTLLRHLPDAVRDGLDDLGSLAPLANLLVESTLEDLLEEMEENEVDRAALIAYPPWITNEFVIEAAASDPRLLAVVNISPDTEKSATTLKNFVKKGAHALKIHPAADGLGPDSRHYRKLMKTAGELGLPVILHTGNLHSRLLFKDPSRSEAAHFAPVFEEFKATTFILAHMNGHRPGVAIDLALEYPNLMLDTSWQPAEVIGEAVRRMGADRILFSSDWPLVGNNFSVGLERVRDCVKTELITEEQAQLILGENAKKLLHL